MFIELSGVTKIFNKGETNEFVAVRGVDLQVEKGEMACISGPSGSGKTTLLSIIGCITLPTSGGAIIGGRKIARLPDHFLTGYRRELIGFIFQNFNLLDHLSVVDNITLPLLPLGVPPGKREELAAVLLEKLSLSHRKTYPAAQLSGGEMQRVAIARALISDPPILIADEPTAHLDRRLSGEVMSIFSALREEGKTIIISSHDPIVTDDSRLNRTLHMQDGQIVSNLER
jgi:putative ABC transport system ATP-binding protein